MCRRSLDSPLMAARVRQSRYPPLMNYNLTKRTLTACALKATSPYPIPHPLSLASNAPPPINLQIHTRNKLRLITRHEHTRIHHILHLANTSHRHVTRELRPVVRRILHTRESTEQPRARYQRADAVHPDLMRAVFRREAFRRLFLVSLPIRILSYQTDREVRKKERVSRTHIPNSPLTSIIPHQPRPRPRRPHTRYIHNHAPFFALHRLPHPRLAA